MLGQQSDAKMVALSLLEYSSGFKLVDLFVFSSLTNGIQIEKSKSVLKSDLSIDSPHAYLSTSVRIPYEFFLNHLYLISTNCVL